MASSTNPASRGQSLQCSEDGRGTLAVIGGSPAPLRSRGCRTPHRRSCRLWRKTAKGAPPGGCQQREHNQPGNTTSALTRTPHTETVGPLPKLVEPMTACDLRSSVAQGPRCTLWTRCLSASIVERYLTEGAHQRPTSAELAFPTVLMLWFVLSTSDCLLRPTYAAHRIEVMPNSIRHQPLPMLRHAKLDPAVTVKSGPFPERPA